MGTNSQLWCVVGIIILAVLIQIATNPYKNGNGSSTDIPSSGLVRAQDRAVVRLGESILHWAERHRQRRPRSLPVLLGRARCQR
jgi:hypothetical protein